MLLTAEPREPRRGDELRRQLVGVLWIAGKGLARRPEGRHELAVLDLRDHDAAVGRLLRMCCPPVDAPEQTARRVVGHLVDRVDDLLPGEGGRVRLVALVEE